jgi:beta-glucosidase
VDEDHVLEVFETKGNRDLAHRIANQSMVLLKNDGILPLKRSLETLAVIGPNADDGRNQLGDYSYHAVLEMNQFNALPGTVFQETNIPALDPLHVKITTVLEGIQRIVSSQTKVVFAKGCSNLAQDTSGIPEAVSVAQQADVVVLVLGDKSGLTPDCTCGETRDSSDIRLPGVQQQLVDAILATGKPVAVVLINGRPLAVPTLAEKANAILEAWMPGEEGGAAVAETLFGMNNPGGKLAMTFPRSAGQVPIFYNYKPSGMRSNWYVNYVNEPVTPQYPFGHGLSYTTFEYNDLSIDRKQATLGEFVTIKCKVKNTGALAGEEVVQLYLCDEYASLPRPVKELKGYLRTALRPGECKTVTFRLPVNMLAYYDLDQTLVLEPGKILVMLGSSSDDIRLHGAFEITGEEKMPVEKRLFVCPVDCA